MPLQSKSKITCITRLVLMSLFLTAASTSVLAQTNTFPSSGNAGVNTTSPPNPLTVARSGSSPWTSRPANELMQVVDKTDNTPQILFGSTYNGMILRYTGTGGTAVNQRFGILTGGLVEAFVVNNDGNIGIGTTTPGYPLDVTGSARINAGSVSSIIGSTAAYWNGFKSNAPTGVWGFQQSERAFMGVGGNLYYRGFSANALSLFNGNTTAEDIILYNKNSADAGFLVLKDSGRVGVGVVSPNYSLDVNGEINATGFRINGTPISGGGSSQWTTSGSNIYYNSGNVGIGTTTPGTYYGVQTKAEISSATSGVLNVNSGSGYSGGLSLSRGAASDWLISNRADGIAGRLSFFNAAGAEQVKFLQNGNVEVAGTINAKYQDVAEWVPSSEQLSAGTVVVLDTAKSNQVISSNAAYDTRVAGVISAQPGIALGESGDGKVLVATTGRVRVKVDASRGPIQIGDLLVTSDISGVAMKSEPVEFAGRKMHMPGTIIGKALEPLTKGTGEILVLLSLQ